MKTSRNGTPLRTATNGRPKNNFKIFSDEDSVKVSGKKVKTVKRRSLAPLQQSVVGKNVLTGYGRGSQSIEESLLNKKNNNISDVLENRTCKSESDVSDGVKKVNTLDLLNEDKIAGKDPLIEDALSLMKATEDIDDSYWKHMAEERRLALEETLAENDKLYNEIDQLTSQNELLKRTLSDLEAYKVMYLSVCESKLMDGDRVEKEQSV